MAFIPCLVDYRFIAPPTPCPRLHLSKRSHPGCGGANGSRAPDITRINPPNAYRDSELHLTSTRTQGAAVPPLPHSPSHPRLSCPSGQVSSAAAEVHHPPTAPGPDPLNPSVNSRHTSGPSETKSSTLPRKRTTPTTYPTPPSSDSPLCPGPSHATDAQNLTHDARGARPGA